MNKKGFLRALSRKLRPLSHDERQASLAYYTEMIQDGMEEGLSEEQAVMRLGSVDEIAGQLLQHGSAGRNAHPRRGIGTAGVIVLAVMAAPVWLPIGIAAVAVLFSLAAAVLSVYAAIWATLVSLYAADFALAVCGPASLLGLAAGFVKGNPTQALCFLAAGCACMGFALLLLLPVNCCARGMARFTKWSLKGAVQLIRRRRLNA